jgi:hypothetical protein
MKLLFNGLRGLSIKVVALWNMTLYFSVDGYHRFGGAYSLRPLPEIWTLDFPRNIYNSL